MTDSELYKLCKKYGRQALLWRQKFEGLLPEVFERRLYEKKGFGSIFEFAFKLAGLSEKQVRRIINVDGKFEKTPILQGLLRSGECSVNKLVRVASVATPENEEELIGVVKTLSKSAVETYIHDMRNGLGKPKDGEKSVPGHTLELSEEVAGRLADLQERGIDVNEMILGFLERREHEIEEEKQKIAANLPEKQSRHVPVETKRVVQKEHGTNCAVRGCKREAVNLHHQDRFAMTGQHNPYYIAPLCKDHHQISHAIDKIFRSKQKIP
ncbi:hypothetical protein KKC94_02385 [Patescibacteria group bacterium]|nr:hypothetical protein [Patescibacteria group bacterium]